MAKHKFSWTHEPATSQTDAEYTLHMDGKDTGYAIQDCRSYSGIYVVNHYTGEGDDFGVTPIAEFRSLTLAKDTAQVAAACDAPKES